MPELPEVETVRQGLIPCMEGAVIERVLQRRPDLRFPLPDNLPQKLAGRRVDVLDRRGKYLVARLDDGMAMILHLGMSGRIEIQDFPPNRAVDFVPAKHDHVVFYLQEGAVVSFNDPRRFGCLDLVAQDELDQHRFFVRMGPEPLGNRFSGAILHDSLKRRNGQIKNVLLDQHVVAGLGNIYVCEALFQAGISPLRKASSLDRAECDALTASIRDVLRRAIAAGGSSLRDYRQADGSLGYFQHSFMVYGRAGEKCPVCAEKHADGGVNSGMILRVAQSGRSTFYCPVCQR